MVLVTPVYTKPLQVMVKVKMKNTRLMAPRSGGFSGVRSDLTSFRYPLCQHHQSAKPAPKATKPGMMKAARHDTQSIMTPTKTGPSALPPLPKTPLIPSVMPRFFALATSQAMPTG